MSYGAECGRQGRTCGAPRFRRALYRLSYGHTRVINGGRRIGARHRSVDEHDVPHRPRALLRVHQNAVPTGEGDRRVVRMRHRASRVHLRLADLARPTAGAPLIGRQTGVARSLTPVGFWRLTYTVSPPRRYANCMTCAFPRPRVSGSSRSTNALGGLIRTGTKNHCPWRTYAATATPERVLRPRPLDKSAHGRRLEGHLRRRHTAHAPSRFGDAGDEPVPLVVAAQELALALPSYDQEQQVAVAAARRGPRSRPRCRLRRSERRSTRRECPCARRCAARHATGGPPASGGRPQRQSAGRASRSTWRLLSSCRD